MISLARFATMSLLVLSVSSSANADSRPPRSVCAAQLKDNSAHSGATLERECDASLLSRTDDNAGHGGSRSEAFDTASEGGRDYDERDVSRHQEAPRAEVLEDAPREESSPDLNDSGQTAGDNGVVSLGWSGEGTSNSTALPVTFDSSSGRLSLSARPFIARHGGSDAGWTHICELPCESAIRPGHYELRLQPPGDGQLMQVKGRVTLNHGAYVDLKLSPNRGRRLGRLFTSLALAGAGAGVTAWGLARHSDGTCNSAVSGSCTGANTALALGITALVISPVFLILGFMTKKSGPARAIVSGLEF